MEEGNYCPKLPQEGNGGDDRLSSLPDDILLTILDRLHVCDAARTGALSGQWRRLPAMVSRLVICAWDFLDASRCDHDQIVRGNKVVVQVIRSVVRARRRGCSTIRLLRIRFFLTGDDDPTSIGHGVADAIATNHVEQAELRVLTEIDDIYCSDEDLLSNRRRFMSLFHACPEAFGGLTSLTVENLRFGGESADISNVITTCKRLMYLLMLNCDLGSAVLQVEHSQVSELTLVKCAFARVELSSLPKLTLVTFESWASFQDRLYFGYVPLLSTVNLTGVARSRHKMVTLSKLLRGATTSVRDLKLGFDSEKIWVQPECLTGRMASTSFHKLRFVNLSKIPEGYDLTWTLFILKAAPNLRELYMSVWDHLCQMQMDEEVRKELSYSQNKGVKWESSESNFQHHSLATLAIFGFKSLDYMINYARHAMEIAVKLEDVLLYDRLSCDKCRGNLPNPTEFPPKLKQDCVKKIITKGINSSATIHFHTASTINAAHLEKMWFH